VSPRVRKIAAHNPDELPAAEYYRQIFWSSAVDLPADLEKLLRESRSRESTCRQEKGQSSPCNCRKAR
jgi:hypothetical protein